MATLKQRLHRKNSSGSYDTIYLETLASLVKMDDGTTLTSKISNMDTAINGKAASNHTHSGYAASSHNHAAKDVTSGTFDAARIPNLAAGKITSGTFDAARIPTLAAGKVAAGTFAATGVKAANGTDYTTARVRNIQASTTDLTAGRSSLANGDIYLVYE